jgi:hypothetical protein
MDCGAFPPLLFRGFEYKTKTKAAENRRTPN